MHSETLTIASRFNGPPRSANGGYVAGCLGQLVGDCATVRLSAPPPLERALTLRRTADGYDLSDGETRVAQAWPGRMDLTPPVSPGVEQASEAARRFARQENDAFGVCFVCGADRKPGDGLRIFAGALDGTDRVAAPWTPEPGLADTTGRVRPACVWAALDCLGAFAIGFTAGQALLLGEMTAELRGPVHAGDEHVILGWREGIDGRRHYTGTALYDARGQCLVIARGTWFAVPVEQIA
jgi:hypothetical protein